MPLILKNEACCNNDLLSFIDIDEICTSCMAEIKADQENKQINFQKWQVITNLCDFIQAHQMTIIGITRFPFEQAGLWEDSF